jgi:hypothetical protein
MFEDYKRQILAGGVAGLEIKNKSDTQSSSKDIDLTKALSVPEDPAAPYVTSLDDKACSLAPKPSVTGIGF